MIELLLKAILSYLLGAIVGGLVVGKLKGGVDIRQLGSGNAGGTNALRTQGRLFAFWVMLIDIGKGWLAAAVIAPLRVPALEAAQPQLRTWMPAACGIAAIVGHIYPVWHGFRGGKGVATLVGAVLALAPTLLILMLLAWYVTVVLFGFVGLASIVAAASLPLWVSALELEPRMPLLVFGTVIAVVILFTHRSNIARMRVGTEPRSQRLWLFGRNGR